MKIAEESESRLVLKNNNILGFIAGVVFTGLGLYFLYTSNFWVGSESLKSAILPGVFTLIGLATLFGSSIVTIRIEKPAKTMTYTRVGLLGRRIKNFQTDNINAVELREQYRIEENRTSDSRTISTPTLQFQLVMILGDDQEIPLGSVSSSHMNFFGGAVLMGGKGKEQFVGQKIAAFLGVPFKEIGPGVQPTGPFNTSITN